MTIKPFQTGYLSFAPAQTPLHLRTQKKSFYHVVWGLFGGSNLPHSKDGGVTLDRGRIPGTKLKKSKSVLQTATCMPAWTCEQGGVFLHGPKKNLKGPKGPAAGRGVFSFTDLRLKLHGPATEGRGPSSAHPPCLVSKLFLVREYFFRTKKTILVQKNKLAYR